MEFVYTNLDSYLMNCMGYEETLNYILKAETKRRFGSVENFLKEIKLDEVVEKIKKYFKMD